MTTSLKLQPFNVKLLNPSKARLQGIKPVTSLDIFDGATGNLHEDGLFSVSIFGRVGENRRDSTFSYIDMRLDIFHPVIYNHLIRLKGLYRGILNGTQYALWDNKIKDFVVSNEAEGETGFSFFLSHWQSIKWGESSSDQRKLRIEVIEKYKTLALIRYMMVLPAGLRDIEIDKNGKVSKDEINDLYHKAIAIASNIDINTADVKGAAAKIYDQSRKSMQATFNEIYATIETIVTGKKGFIQGKWGSRRMFNGTRNVISAMDTGVADLEAQTAIRVSDTIAGLFQVAKGALPKVIYWLRMGPLSWVFTQDESNIPLVDMKTHKTVFKKIHPETRERWYTEEGLSKFINIYGNASVRHKPIVIEGHYLLLIYQTDTTFKILRPNEYEQLSKDIQAHCSPITWCELLYLSAYRDWYDLVGAVTRYPITGIGSTYPTTIYVKTTVTSKQKHELDDQWTPKGETGLAKEFPIRGAEHIDSLMPHPCRLTSAGGLGADRWSL